MSARAILLAASLVGLGATIAAGDSRAVDLFHTQRAIPATAASPILAGHAICSFGAPSNPLTLREAVERALCTGPDTRDAWTIIEERAAAVGVSKAAYLPTLTATGQLVHDDSVTNVRDHASLSSNYSTIVQSDSLQLGWVLYDFGGRRAALKNAKALLSAAQANEDAVLQQTFSDTAKAYYSAQAAMEQLVADAAIVADARDSSIAAQERITRGAAPSTEGYQALTAYEQALVTQTKDRGLAAAALGTLANAMGLSPDTALTLESVDQNQLPNKGFTDTVAALMQHAERTHPAVLAAEKELEASQAAIVQAKAQGRPTVKLVGDYSRNNEPVQLGLGLPHYPATGHDGYVGFQVSIPLFSGFATHYQVRQAQAQRDQQSVALDKARQQVALQVWTSYQTLQTDTQNLDASLRLQEVATQAWESAQRRYKSGIGTILELLSTQTALAQARQMRVEAITGWRYDRLALASALGQLGWDDLSDQ
jgi:outer membrane protein